MALSHLSASMNSSNFDIYYEAVTEIISASPITGLPSNPTQLLPHLYIGALRHAESLAVLKRYKINCVLNVAAPRRHIVKSPYADFTSDIIQYRELPIEDNENYNIVQHFKDAFAFIEKCRKINGIILVHCQLGINRSATICLAYIMHYKKWTLLRTLDFVKEKRHTLLSNRGFRKQLVNWAINENKLDGISSHEVLRKISENVKEEDGKRQTLMSQDLDKSCSYKTLVTRYSTKY